MRRIRRRTLLVGGAAALAGCDDHDSDAAAPRQPPTSTGTTAPASPGGGPTLDVQRFGALGNGATDDTAAIQKALDAVPTGGGTVHFPPGVYRVSPSADGHFLRFGPIIDLTGAGMEVSTLKPVDHAGNWRDLLSPRAGTGVERLSVRHLGFDMNTFNNPVIGDPTATGMPRIVIRSASGSAPSLTIDQCRFADCTDVNTLYLAGGSVVVSDCSFTGTAGQRAAAWDHSSIYAVARASGHIRIAGNMLTGTLGSGASRTAIETHGGTQTIVSNQISAYLNGMNITDIASSSTDGVVVRGNQISNVMIGMQIWSRKLAGDQIVKPGMRNLRIEANTVVIHGDAWRLTTNDAGSFACGILFTIAAGRIVAGIVIESNTITYLSARSIAGANDYLSAGITLWGSGEISDVSILSNTITNPLSAGLVLNATLWRVDVSDNTFRNPASGAATVIGSAFRSMITLGGDLDGVHIRANSVSDTRTPCLLDQLVGGVGKAVLRGTSTISGNELTATSAKQVPQVGATVSQ